MLKHTLIYTLLAAFCLSTSVQAALAPVNVKKLNQDLNSPIVYTQAGAVGVALENDSVSGPKIHVVAKTVRTDQNLMIAKIDYEKRVKYTATLSNGQQVSDTIRLWGERQQQIGTQGVSLQSLVLHKANKMDITKIRGTIYYPEFTNVQTAVLAYAPNSFVQSFKGIIGTQYEYSMVDVENQTVVTIRNKNPKKKIQTAYFVGASYDGDISMNSCFAGFAKDTCEVGVPKGQTEGLLLYFAQKTKVNAIPFSLTVKSQTAVAPTANMIADQQAIEQLLINQYTEADATRNFTVAQKKEFIIKKIPAEYASEVTQATDEDINGLFDLYVLGSTWGIPTLTEFQNMLKDKSKVAFTFTSATTANVKVTLYIEVAKSSTSVTLKFKKTGSTWTMLE